VIQDDHGRHIQLSISCDYTYTLPCVDSCTW